MTTKRYGITFSVLGSMRCSVEIDPEKSTGVGLASAAQIREAMESGQLSISSDEGGEAILTADGTVVGTTLHVRDETSWTDFVVRLAS